MKRTLLARRSVLYATAVAACGLALLITTRLHAVIDSGSFTVFLTAVVTAAAIGGLGPGLLATLVSVACIDFFFLAPRFSLRLMAGADVILLSVYALAAAATSYLAEWLREGRRKAEAEADRAAALALLFERNMGELQKDLQAATLRDQLTLGTPSQDPAASPYSRRQLPS